MKWDGVEFSEVGTGVGGNNFPQIWDLNIVEEKLYAGGQFLSAGDIPANGIASWDGAKWCGLGNELDGFMELANYNDNIHIAFSGIFDSNPGFSFSTFWNGESIMDSCSISTTLDEEPHFNLSSIEVYPTPTTDLILFNWGKILTFDFPARIQVHNILGQSQYQGVFQNGIELPNSIAVSKWPKGIYLVSIFIGNLKITKKILVQ